MKQNKRPFTAISSQGRRLMTEKAANIVISNAQRNRETITPKRAKIMAMQLNVPHQELVNELRNKGIRV